MDDGNLNRRTSPSEAGVPTKGSEKEKASPKFDLEAISTLGTQMIEKITQSAEERSRVERELFVAELKAQRDATTKELELRYAFEEKRRQEERDEQRRIREEERQEQREILRSKQEHELRLKKEEYSNK